MPELPEVETVKRALEKEILNQTLLAPIIYVKRALQSDYDSFSSSIIDKKIISLSRKGKFIIFNLNEGRLIFHLRMEGKLFVVDKEKHDINHLSLFLPFKDSEKGIAFYDTRKFGIFMYLKNGEEGPLANVGKEPFEIKPKELYEKYHSSNKMLKQLLIDQTIMSGLGNIYANEVLFSCKLSPFMKGNELALSDCQDIIRESIRILNKAIELNGSTIKSYHATADTSGSFQNFLKVYGKESEECPLCHTIIEKRFVDGRGTQYCPKCQNTGLTIAITGKIASGKSLATSYFKEEGFVTFSADECVHSLYNDKMFLNSLKKKFPEIFTPTLNKEIIKEKLTNDKIFKHKYLSYIFKEVKIKANDFIISNNHKNKALEIPVLFDANMQSSFSIIVGVETTKQIEHLKERGEDTSRIDFNKMNSYDLHHDEINYILKTDGTKEELHQQVKELIKKISLN